MYVIIYNINIICSISHISIYIYMYFLRWRKKPNFFPCTIRIKNKHPSKDFSRWNYTHQLVTIKQLYEINQKTLHLGLPPSHWLKACASGQNWVFWKKHHEMIASGKGCTTCFWLFTLPGIDAEHRLPSRHHHQDQTLPEAKAGLEGLWSRSK